MTYSILGPTPLFAIEVLLESIVVFVLVVPPTIIAGGLWAGYMIDIDIFDEDDDDKEVTQTCWSREDSVLSERQRRSGRESTEAAIDIVIMVKIVKIVIMVMKMVLIIFPQPQLQNLS